MSVTVLDVSNVQGSVDWARVAKSGIRAAYLKATEGLTYNDSRFQEFRREANRAGIHVGAYHFARPDLHPQNPEMEADHFCSVVGKLGRTDLRPALDFETQTRHLDDAGMVKWARRFNRRVKTRLGPWPVFYSYPALVEQLHAAAPIGSGLWLASYGRNDGVEHSYAVPAPWHRVVAHQFSSDCAVAGCSGRVDLSHAPSLGALLVHPVVGRMPLKRLLRGTRSIAV